jgi:hypothetical protein
MTDTPKLTVVVPSSTIAEIAAVELPDPWDVERLRTPQNYAETSGTKKLLIKVPVRKPPPQSFIRVHPNEAFRVNVPVVVLKEDREFYLVGPDMRGELVNEVVEMTMFTAVDRQGNVFFWPVPMPSPDGRKQEWHRSAREAAELAIPQWVRVVPNMALQGYDVISATGILTDPVWPDVPFKELLKIAFRDYRIDTVDHPLVRRLRGLQ